jgi:hypothetical protein
MKPSMDAIERQVLATIGRVLCAVPDGWPPPPALRQLLDRVRCTDKPMRWMMLEEACRWVDAIKRAKSVQVAPVLRGGYYADGIVIQHAIPEPCAWIRMYFRKRGRARWHLLGIHGGTAWHLETTPEAQQANGDEWDGSLEFVAIGMLPAENSRQAPEFEYGAPSNVIAVPVPREYPVPAAMLDIAFA